MPRWLAGRGRGRVVNFTGGREEICQIIFLKPETQIIAQSIATYTASLAATKPSQRIILPTSGVSIGVQAAPTGWTRYYFDDKQIQRAVQPRSFGGTKKMLLNAEAKGRWKVSRNTEEEGTTQKREKAASDI